MEAGKLKILVADGDPRWRRQLGEYLKQQGCEVVFAKDGWALLYQVRMRFISLILVNHNLPCFNGLDLLHRIREIKADTPVIIMSDQLKDRDIYASRNQDERLERFWHRPKPKPALSAIIKKSAVSPSK